MIKLGIKLGIKLEIKLGSFLARFSLALATLVLAICTGPAQQVKPTAKESKAAPTEKNAAQIELLETRYRFEANGDSSKEVHTRVRINNELGARQFARLNFDFNRSFQSVEIPFVRVTHASGGTAEILPSAVTDNPDPAVVDYPAYHDVRVKSVRILGLQPDDLLEYRVITTTTHHPLAPDFWLDHTFDRSGVVSKEVFELDLPDSLVPSADHPHGNSLSSTTPGGTSTWVPAVVTMRVNPDTPSTSTLTSGDGAARRKAFRWEDPLKDRRGIPPEISNPADVSLTTFASWRVLAERLIALWRASQSSDDTIEQKARELTGHISTSEERTRILYEFVSKKIKTVDLQLIATGFRTAGPAETLAHGYGTALDKLRLLDGLSNGSVGELHPAFVGEGTLSEQVPMPSLLVATVGASFVGLGPQPTSAGGMRVCDHCGTIYWLDPALEVAPFGMLPANERAKTALFLGAFPGEGLSREGCWRHIPNSLPFASAQQVRLTASIAPDGNLSAKVKYALRGDNELLLRVAFHKTEKEKWKDVAQMLALSDGFRGQIMNVTASDPYATTEPFTVEYEISQPKFVDWSKKTARIPAILPLPGLPDAPSAAQIEAKKPIALGTPLAIDLEATIELPAGATAQAPIGTAVKRDYASFTSKYSVQGNTLNASRSLHFISSELPASRATDFNAFLHAVQSDQSQLFMVQLHSQK